MNILGVGPLELVIVLVLGLIVLGPERLPEAGRFLGRQLAKVLAWQQQSPEAQMIQQIRQEFEGEIFSLRDELLRTRRQLDLSSELRELQNQTNTLLKLTGDQLSASARPLALPSTSTPKPLLTISPARGTVPIGGPLAIAEQAAPAPTAPPYDINDAPQDNPPYNTVHLGQDDNRSPITPVEVSQAVILAEIRQLAADLTALQEQLRARGLVDPTWQFPSQRSPS